MSYLELRDISKVYGEGAAEVHALQRVDLSVDAGSLVAVMGASGSGKSTLLTIAGSLEDPTSGEVYVGGRALSSLSRNGKAQLRRQSIGYVFQDYNLLAGLSAVENVSLPLELDGSRPARPSRRRWKSLDDFGLKDRASHYPDQLSGGERQRVAIARAVVGGRQLLLRRRTLRSARLHQRRGSHAPYPCRLSPGHGRRRGDPRRPARFVGRPCRSSSATDGSSTRRSRSMARKRYSPTSRTHERRPSRTTGHRICARTDHRWRPGPPSHDPLGLAPLQARVAPTAAHPAPRHRGRGRGRGRCGRCCNTPPPANAGFGTADDLAIFTNSGKQSDLHCSPPRSPRWSIASAPSRSSRTRHSMSPAAPRHTNFGPRTRTAPTAARCSSCSPGTIRPGPTRSPSPLGWRPTSTCGWATLVPRRKDGRRHRAEPPEPARRVRAGSPGAGDATRPR